MINPVVSVNIVTYNHAKYISQAIEGALKQKTNFQFEILIGEDDSSDRTREICIEYAKNHPEKIRLFLNDRKNVIYINGKPTGRWNMINLIKNSKGKYIALCEGDDYWTDPYKLQKQVDFLENNPDYGMVHSDYDVLYEKTNKIIKSIQKKRNQTIPKENFFEELLGHNFIATLTVCARKRLINNFLKQYLVHYKNWKMGDMPLWLYIAKHSKIGYIDESLAARRLLPESASQSKKKKNVYEFIISACEISFYFVNQYGCSEATKKILKKQYQEIMLKYSFLLRKRANAKESFQYLEKNEENYWKKIYFYLIYLGSKNIFIWILIRLYLLTKPKK